jgi:predicted transcriptional regulator
MAHHMSAKEKAMSAVASLSDEATLEDAIETLVFLHKVERGLEQREAGEGVSQEEMEKRFRVSWRK